MLSSWDFWRFYDRKLKLLLKNLEMGEGDRNSLLEMGPLERYAIKHLVHKGLPELARVTIPYRLVPVHFGFGTI
jgi:hypothetical protein